MPPHLIFALTQLADFLKCKQRFAKIEGFLEDLEAYTLMQLAAHGQGSGAIVEIGSYMGRSTAFLAAGAKDAGRERVYAVDHFRGSPEQKAGQPFSHPVLEKDGSTFGVFQANLRAVNLDDHVVAIQASSVEAARSWKEPIRLLFIDGDHSYEAAREDWKAWSPFLGNRGYVCFHDIGRWPGVTQFYQEMLRDNPVMKEMCTVQSLKVVQKNRVSRT
jgi:predicted O-methyltransferase YrrM